MDCEHLNRITDNERGELICHDCGEVLEQIFEPSSYVLGGNTDSSDRSKKPSQYTALSNQNNFLTGLGSFMGFHYSKYQKDKDGIPLPAKDAIKFTRFQRYHTRAKIENETQYRAMEALNKVGEKLCVPITLMQRAGYFSRKFSKKADKHERKNNALLLAAVSLYLAVKEVKYPLPISAIADAFKELNHRVSCKAIVNVALTMKPKFKAFFNYKTTTSETYLNDIINKSLNSEIISQRLAKEKVDSHAFTQFLLENAGEQLKKLNIEVRGGRNPYILAVATIYSANLNFAKQHNVRPIFTQHILAQLANVAEYSLRDHWTTLISHRA